MSDNLSSSKELQTHIEEIMAKIHLQNFCRILCD